MSQLWYLPAESTEWVGPITVTVDGQPVATFEVAALPAGTRPTEDDWDPPLVLEGRQGVLVGPGTAHLSIWVRVTANPEIPVLKDVATVRRN